VPALGRFVRRRREVNTIDLLRDRLEHFRDLVEKNNRVLELIADAGEMLGGEYIFDISYLRSLTRELQAACHDVVDDLSGVTKDRFPELLETVWRIDADLQAVVEGRVVVAETDLVVPLERIDEDMADVVGAKMARLGALRRRLGCRVPDGFVVSTYACQLVLEESGIADDVERTFAGPERLEPSALAERAAALQARAREFRLPRGLSRAIAKAVQPFGSGRRGCGTFAVRSSALGEDSELSFAGQFSTVLGVPPDEVGAAYREVIASMYGAGVMEYRQASGLHPARGLMAVGCLCMVPASSGGVLYSLDPLQPGKNVMVVTVARGLGKTVVEGSGPVDRFELSRTPPHDVLTRAVASKPEMLVVGPGAGVQTVAVAEEERERAALTDVQLHELAVTAMAIEGHMKCAVDVEWAIDQEGRLFILQARPLRIAAAIPPAQRDLTGVTDHHAVLLRKQGAVACAGVASGPVHLVADEAALDDFPSGAVLVAKTSTPRLSAAIARAGAVITDVGTTTGHLAALAREFRVPTILDTGNATRLLAGAGEITVDAEANVVYAGRVDRLLHNQLVRSSTFEETSEFRMLRRMLKRIAPLNLRDPQARGFSAANCSTYHDIIRFAHERAVRELAEGSWIAPAERSQFVRTLDLPVPLDLVVVDLGGGLNLAEGGRRVGPDSVLSEPLRALVEGLVTEGVWATDPARMDPSAFMASATRSTPWLYGVAARPQQNLAIISRQYLNLNLHLGFHFNIVDCYSSEVRNDNYIYFRFTGGVTELTRRSRRAALLRQILERHDFLVESKGDLVIGRIKKIALEGMLERMRMLGRLIGFTRQLDILLSDDAMVEHCMTRFLEGKYNVFEA
jgi:pyruvate, water dikinase